jgi:hypothetical protein
MKDQRKNDFDRMSGRSKFSQAQRANVETAEEARLISQGEQSLATDQQGLFEDFIVRIVRKEGMILQKKLDKPIDIPLDKAQAEQVRQILDSTDPQLASMKALLQSRLASVDLSKIVGQENVVALMPWLNLSKEDIQGDYDFQIEVGSTLPINEETRKRDFMQVAPLFAQNPKIDPDKLTEWGMEVFDIKRDLFKSDEQVAAEQEAQPPSDAEVKIAERQMKDQTDLKKTQMKSQTAIETTKLKVQGDRGNNFLAILGKGGK